ncbi:MAG TPA: MBL fold metallo-hydrolase [Acidimicrobiales bacterium]|nr:MBL fold metallo-hydrolase [Acidimicrobiales bacterium]
MSEITEEPRLHIRQLLSGRDFAVGDPVAQQMVNFTYVIGDREKGEAVIVDPAYDPTGLVELVESEGLKVVGALATHYHPDHVGGSMMGHTLNGIAQLNVPVHVHRDEAEFVARVTGVSAGDLVAHDSGDSVMVGDIPIELLHTPGHTPGSMCFLVGGVLVSGDTLFLEGCGRTDFPGSDPAQMYDSLMRLASLPDDTVVCAGHWYSQPRLAPMSEVKEHNYVLSPSRSKEQWLMMFGGQ